MSKNIGVPCGTLILIANPVPKKISLKRFLKFFISIQIGIMLIRLKERIYKKEKNEGKIRVFIAKWHNVSSFGYKSLYGLEIG